MVSQPVPLSVQEPAYFVRFNRSQRMEHLLFMIAFTVLVVTGLPQKFSSDGWAQWIILNLGGIDITRFIHRTFGYVFALLAVYHLASVSFQVFLRRARPSMLLALKDFWDAVATLRYNLGLTEEHPQFDRFDFRQKFEYWGMVFGGAIMILSGFILLYPTLVTRFLPGELVPVAKIFHSYEGLMAFLIIVVWHLYGAHLGPGRFPGDTTIFTGKISRERMVDEHPLEYARLVVRESPGEEDPDRDS